MIALNSEVTQAIGYIVPDLNPTYYLSPEMAAKLRGATELPTDIIKELISTLSQKKSEIEEKVQKLENDHPNYGEYVAFDIGINETFLEVEQTEENGKFYALEEPSQQSLFVVKILAALLGRTDVITQDDRTTWNNIKKCFKEEMGDKISNSVNNFLDDYFLGRIKEESLDFSDDNLFKLKLLMHGQSFTEDSGPKDCALLEVIYLAIIEVLASKLGIKEEGEPYFVWTELTCEINILQTVITALSNI